MSVAFAKEESAEAAETILPDRVISDRVNLVTEAGLKLMQQEMANAEKALGVANLLYDVNEKRRQSAAPIRDLRYYSQRLQTAKVLSSPNFYDVVEFGHSVTFQREYGRNQTFRIFGEDEANPSQSTISHGSPVAIALMGKSVSDVVMLGNQELVIIDIF